MRASIAAACAMAQGEGSGGQDKALRRLWVSQAGWEAGAGLGQQLFFLLVAKDGREPWRRRKDGLEQPVWW